MTWPFELLEVQKALFGKAYKVYLAKMRKAHAELDLGDSVYSPPEFEIEKKREDWVEIFAHWTQEQRFLESGTRLPFADLVDKSLKQFIFYPQGRKTALFMTLEEIHALQPQLLGVSPQVQRLELPSDWPPDHTLDVEKYVEALFPRELQKFVQGHCRTFHLHDSDFIDAYAFEFGQGYRRAFAFKGDRGEVRGRVFVAENPDSIDRYRLVAYQVRGNDSPKLYAETIGPIFGGGQALFVKHQNPAPISVLKEEVAGEAIDPNELVLIGYQNALGRVLTGPAFHGEWQRDFLTRDGIEIDRFVNKRTGRKLFSVRNMYGDEIQEMLGLLWHKGARRFIYLGSAGALDPAIQVGDLVVPAEFSEPGGRWRTFSNGAGELPIALAAPLKIIRGVRQGTVSTLIEETRERMENLAGLGIQAIDIEANHFARFFDGREAQTSIILAITDLPLGGVKLDEGYEVNFAAVKSICQVFPHLIDFPRTS